MDLFWNEGGNQMKDLVFVGGAKGVGKTSVLQRILEILPREIVNTGKIYSAAKKNNHNPEMAIFNSLINYSGIVDTHYAGYKGEGFVRGFSADYLKRLDQTKKIGLVLIDLDAETLFERRKRDVGTERKYDFEHMTKELEMNRLYFEQYCEDLLTNGNVILNEHFEECVNSLLEFLK